jgi:hypothetical protein
MSPGHYGDAGEAAALMSFTLGCDMVLTGHSLGRNKLEHLLKGRELHINVAVPAEGPGSLLHAASPAWHHSVKPQSWQPPLCSPVSDTRACARSCADALAH